MEELRAEYERLTAALAGGKVPREEVAAFAAAAAAGHDDAGESDRYETRLMLAKVELALCAAGRYGDADGVYRLRQELARRDYRLRYTASREPSALVRAWAYRVWRFTSRYGTSPLRLAWTAFNVVFWFSVLYFILDVAAVRLYGGRGFAAAVLGSYAGYFIIGFEGLFPGTAPALGANFWTQLALAFENGIGAVLLASLVSLVARRSWRGLG